MTAIDSDATSLESPQSLATRLNLPFSNPRLVARALTHRSYINENPDAARAFLKGVYRGFAYAYENPDEAVDIMLKYAPTLERDVIEAQFLLDKPAVLNEDVLANGYGHIDTDKMQRTIDVMRVAYDLSDNVPTTEEMFTIDFLPSQDEVPPVE